MNFYLCLNAPLPVSSHPAGKASFRTLSFLLVKMDLKVFTRLCVKISGTTDFTSVQVFTSN